MKLKGEVVDSLQPRVEQMSLGSQPGPKGQQLSICLDRQKLLKCVVVFERGVCKERGS